VDEQLGRALGVEVAAEAQRDLTRRVAVDRDRALRRPGDRLEGPAREHPRRALCEGVLGAAACQREAERQAGSDGQAQSREQQSWSSSHRLTSLCHKAAAPLSHEIFTGLQPTA